jgi:ubiquinone/menaquinone biosynthesis C-methylase UbiE
MAGVQNELDTDCKPERPAAPSDCMGVMIRLDKIKYDWDSLAERDAFWAILTDGSKAGGKWDVAEFMTTGNTEIETVMDHLGKIDCIPDADGAALDFGCGVGRLTQPLARYFASCVGVDISKQMIQRAESLNRYAHCRYMTISDTRLPFADASFLFIYSNIVLQHMPQRLSKEYLREFIRVLAAGGVLVFGVQDSFAVRDVSSLLFRVRQVLRMRSRIKDALGVGSPDMQMHCMPERVVRQALGSAEVLDIQLTNTAARDFNGRIKYLREAPASGYIGKQYCVVKLP